MQESEIGLFINNGFLLIYCTIKMISEQSQTAGTTLMPSLLRRSIPMLARMVWSWMWRNVRYLLHPDMLVHWMSSGQRKTKSPSKVPSKHLAPGWPETVWLCVDQNTCIWKVRRVFFAFESIGLFSVNPPTSRDLCETYVLPVLLYSCEHWVINHQLIEKLELVFSAWYLFRLLRLLKGS